MKKVKDEVNLALPAFLSSCLPVIFYQATRHLIIANLRKIALTLYQKLEGPNWKTCCQNHLIRLVDWKSLLHGHFLQIHVAGKLKSHLEKRSSFE